MKCPRCRTKMFDICDKCGYEDIECIEAIEEEVNELVLENKLQRGICYPSKCWYAECPYCNKEKLIEYEPDNGEVYLCTECSQDFIIKKNRNV